jgi:glycosyltransferase involved in cell wall biosynthesis
MRLLLDLQACQASSMNRGIGRYSLALAQAIVRNSGAHDVHIVLNNGFPEAAAALRKSFGAVLPITHIHSFSTPLPVAEGNPDNRWRVQAAERIREHYMASLRPDVLHVASLFEGFGDNAVNSLLHGDGRFDTAVTLYDLIPLLRKERYLTDPNLATWYHRKLDSLKNADLLVAISANARMEAIDALGVAPDRVVNISSAVDSIFVPRTLSPDTRADLMARHGLHRPFIMYTGGIDYRKNIEGLIEAYAALPGAMRRQYQLAIVCSIRDPDRVRLQRLATKLRLAEDDLVLTGYVTDDDLVSLYNCTALFVFPSLHEGFGLPVLEAMACGAPVIGANTSSIPEVIGRPDAMFDPSSVPAIAAAMARVLGDGQFADALRAHGLAQAKLFSWDASARRAIAGFEETHRRNAAARTTAVMAAAGAPLPRPRMAFVGSLAGQADAALLEALSRYYHIELVPVHGSGAAQANGGYAQRTLDWFDLHAPAYDRIVYRFSNTPAHAPLFDLLERHPGVVILNDFFLDASLHQADRASTLYAAHGYRALANLSAPYPANRAVIERAFGVIVHAGALLALARHWYGQHASHDWHLVPAGGADAGACMHAAIEECMRNGFGAAQQNLVRDVATLSGNGPSASDRLQAAAAIAANRRRNGTRQLLLDVTQDVAHTVDDPVTRLRRDLVRALVAAAAPSWHIEPVRHDGKRYRYARCHTLALLGVEGLLLDDAVADPGTGDVLLGIDGGEPPILPPAWQALGVVLHSGPLLDDFVQDTATLAGKILAGLPGALPLVGT